MTIDDTGAIGNAWRNAPVKVTLSPSDGGAGVAAIYYTTDGSTPTVVNCENPTGSSRCYRNQGPRRPGEVLTLSALGAHTIKWMSVDIKGNQEAVQSQRLLVAADDAVGDVSGTVPPTLALSLGAPVSFSPLTPGLDLV